MTVVVVVATLAVAVLAFVIQRRRWAKRTEAWDRVAATLGLAPLTAPELPPEAASLAFFRRGRRRRLRTGIGGRAWGVEVLLADYEYVTGSGKSRSVHRRTVCVLTDDELSLPHFVLRPERRIVDRLGELLGGRDFDFEADAAFSAAFVLQGDDEDAVRAVFGPTVRSQLVAAAATERFELEGRGRTLLVHRSGLADPESAGHIVRRAEEIAALFRS